MKYLEHADQISFLQKKCDDNRNLILVLYAIVAAIGIGLAFGF